MRPFQLDSGYSERETPILIRKNPRFRMETAGFESLNYAVRKSLSEASPKRILENCLKASTCFEFHSFGSLDTNLLASLWVDAVTSSTLCY